jgi:hypothetical protein
MSHNPKASTACYTFNTIQDSIHDAKKHKSYDNKYESKLNSWDDFSVELLYQIQWKPIKCVWCWYDHTPAQSLREQALEGSSCR